MAVELHDEVIGGGPPVVVLHGLFGAGRNWHSVARKLSTLYAFHLLDLRNHGQSPHTATMSYTDMCADLGLLLAQRGLAEVILVGHSMGGKAAMNFALSSADAVRRLIVVDIAPVSYPDRFAEMIAAMRALDLALIKRRADADRALARAIPEDAVRLFILQNLVFEAGRARWRANLPVLERDMPLILGPLPSAGGARFDGPTVFIRGQLSDRIDDRYLPAIDASFSDYRIETVAGAGHLPHAEAPAAFIEVFTRALAGPGRCS